MNATEKIVLERFKELVLKRVPLYKMILFGSRARDTAEPHSDMDVIVILEDCADDQAEDHVSHCAWEAGFEHGIVVVPVTFKRKQWEKGPERHSLLFQAVQAEGIIV